MSTLKKQVKIKGKGIHSGLPVSMTVKPSKKNGIFFRKSYSESYLAVTVLFLLTCASIKVVK